MGNRITVFFLQKKNRIKSTGIKMKLNYTTADEAVKAIKSNDRVFIHSVAAAPHILIDAMVRRAPELKNVEIMHLHTEGDAPYVKPEYEGIFRLHSLFVGANARKATQAGLADYVPVYLSETPILYRRNILPLDVALVQVSPPDRHGFCSLGVSIDVSLAAVETAKIVIAQINPQMPRSFGDGLVHISKFKYIVEHDNPLIESVQPPISEAEQKIANYISELVEDGATLQMGIGGIPNAVLIALTHHKRLGVHTEMFSDGLIPLVEEGIVTGECKKLNKGKIVSTFVMGSKAVYDFLDQNPLVEMLDVEYVNDEYNIRQNPKVTSINSAIEIDLTGQVCADSIGTKHFSGVGGQMDFMRGASFSQGGKPIIALTSTTNKGETKIVPFLKQGAGVVTSRAVVHHIVTEYGRVDLYGKSLKERAKLLISIAHPDHREELESAAYERFHGHIDLKYSLSYAEN
jgi:4-hydroxybutyrate CoA-transferase